MRVHSRVILRVAPPRSLPVDLDRPVVSDSCRPPKPVPKRSLAKPNPTLVCSRHPGIVWSQLELILFRRTSAASAQSRLGETTLTPPRFYHIKKREERSSFFFFFFVNRPHSKIYLVIRRSHAASSSAFVQVCIISRLSARAAD